MLRKMLTTIAINTALAGSTYATPIEYTIDPDHTQTIFSWSHSGLSNPAANFNEIRGTITFDRAEPTKSSVNVTIVVASIDTHVRALDDVLKRDQFLDAEKFPTITFKSTRVEGVAGKSHFKVTGELTVHGVTKPVILDATLNNADNGEGATVGFNATTTFKRSEFGVGAYAPDIGDTVRVSITTEASAPTG